MINAFLNNHEINFKSARKTRMRFVWEHKKPSRKKGREREREIWAEPSSRSQPILKGRRLWYSVFRFGYPIHIQYLKTSLWKYLKVSQLLHVLVLYFLVKYNFRRPLSPSYSSYGTLDYILPLKFTGLSETFILSTIPSYKIIITLSPLSPFSLPLYFAHGDLPSSDRM